MRSSSEKSLAGWEKDDLRNITSDIATNEFRSSNSKLSVWYIDSLEDLDKAALAIAMSGQRIEDFKLIAIESKDIEDNFSIDNSPGITIVTDLIEIHRDICSITHCSLDVLLSAYKTAIDDQKCFRYKTKQIKDIVRGALDNNRIDISSANDKLSEELSALKLT